MDLSLKERIINLSSGVLDILVPEKMLKEFTEEGGKFYKNYQDLLKYGKDKGVKVNLDSKL
jgi:hypothetical protein